MNPLRDTQESWFAARTRCGAELGVRDKLERLGTENWLPVEVRMRTRGKRTYEHPVLPGMIFVHTTRREACDLVNDMGLPVRYLIDPATRTLLVVPDRQLEDFRRVLDLSREEGGLVDCPLELGDFVRVTKGPLTGVEGRILEFHGRTYVVVGLMDCWFAKAEVPRAWLERIDNFSDKLN